MTRTLCLTTCTLLLAGFIPALGQAQQAPATQPPRFSRVAVIDISEVFQNHQRFKAMMDEIKKEIDGFELELRATRKEINQKITALQEFKTGTAPYQQKEKEIAKLQADLQVAMQLKRKSILAKEAKVYHQAYAEVLAQVSAFSERHNIDLVLRFDSKPIDATKRESVLKGVNRAVVYQRSMDITKFILNELNRGLPPQKLGTRPVLPSKPGTR